MGLRHIRFHDVTLCMPPNACQAYVLSGVSYVGESIMLSLIAIRLCLLSNCRLDNLKKQNV